MCPGASIRQGLAHLIDKSQFTADAANCISRCLAIDNPVPPSTASANGLTSPNSCGWDRLFPSALEVGPCEVGPIPVTGQVGGISYHFAAATPCGVSGGCASTPLFPWEPGLGTPDFCAAADHFIAAGLAIGKDLSTCALTGIASGVTAHTVNVFTRDTNPRTNLGNSLFDEMCALFTGVFKNTSSAQCNSAVALPSSITSGPFVTQTTGPIFPPICPISSCATNQWWIYTAAFTGVFPFDQSLYGVYNSIFASNNGSFDVPPCSSLSVPTSAASDYMYNCIPLYDQLSNAMEYSACVVSANSPTAGQTSPTFGNCSGGVVSGDCSQTNPCDALSAGYQAEDLFGKQVVTIPVFAQLDQYGYSADMTSVINGVGVGIPQFYAWLNAHTTSLAASGTLLANCPATPTIIGPDCFRQGFAIDTTSLNPYDASTFWDFNIIGNIYDSLLRENPMNPGQLIGWMTTGFAGCANCTPTQLGYTPCAGTTFTYRFSLRKDLSWQDGTPLTSWDVEFSYLTLKATGAFQSNGLSQVICFHILSPSVFDVELSSVGPFTLFSLGSPTVFPGRHWSAAGLSAWDSAVASCANSSTPDSCFTTACSSCNSVTATVSGPKFDPIANGILIGSSMFQCLNPSTGVVGSGCSSSGFENPGVGGSYQLTRYGAGTTPGVAVPSSKYFRSTGTLAVYLWTGDNG
ncbi:MAG TPA: hypothetical protein VNA15_08260, partial [Candidatus Angelobacter sp.]|nr:hypothetical protein [Candidatus Angelobacter sp.]